MIVVLSILVLLTLAVAFLTLAAVGNTFKAIQAQIAAVAEHQVWQHRVTRRVLSEKVLPAVGYREPEPMEEQLNKLLAQWSERTKAMQA